MMWNWLVSALAVGSAVVLYDGSPFHPDNQRLLELIDDERISVFGTSPSSSPPWKAAAPNRAKAMIWAV
jgi:acyl-coenzyme A synthetase/AMP-(fatty) acid ligase